MGRFQLLKKHFSRRLTVMFIPHSSVRSFQFNVPVVGILAGLTLWTGLTLWSGFIASRHVDYWRARTNEQLLKAKVWYFSQEIKKSREYIDRVRETEVALRNLLNLKSKQAIVQSGVDANGMGGPSLSDQAQLSRLLKGNLDVPLHEMSAHFQSVQMEGEKVLGGFQEISEYIRDQHELYMATPQGWPAVGRITSRYGVRTSPIPEGVGDDQDFHRGIDIANESGTPILATAEGIVKVSSWHGGYGRLVVIDHGRGYETYYAHASKLLVQVGDHVQRGQTISYMGTSGHSTGYHVHYEVWKNGRALNPMQYVQLGE